MKLQERLSAVRQREERHTVSNFRRTVNLERLIDDRKTSNSAVLFKRMEIVSGMKGTDETKDVGLDSV